MTIDERLEQAIDVFTNIKNKHGDVIDDTFDADEADAVNTAIYVLEVVKTRLAFDSNLFTALYREINHIDNWD